MCWELVEVPVGVGDIESRQRSPMLSPIRTASDVAVRSVRTQGFRENYQIPRLHANQASTRAIDVGYKKE
jgi:hypothetical protein